MNRAGGAGDDEEEKDLLDKIQRTYQKYLEKKQQKAPRLSKSFKDEQDKEDLQKGQINWKFVRYEDLDLLDLNQESSRTATLFIINLILFIMLLFLLLGILAITLIVQYASDEVEVLHEMKSVDSSILKHNLFQFLTLMPTVLIVMQIMVNLTLILLENVDEVFFYIRDNMAGIWMLKGVFGLSLVLFTGMLGFKLQQNESGEVQTLSESADGPGSQDGVEDDTKVETELIQFKHIITCILSSIHALVMLLHGQSKLKDTELVYMRFLYDKYKKELPKQFTARSKKLLRELSSSEGDEADKVESDNSEREVKFF